MTRLRDRPRMVIFCVDGGVAQIVRQHDLFNVGRQFSGHLTGPVVPLTTIYPSSTAPAHASFLTGAHPEHHGIVGNRFWSGEPVEEILRRCNDPVETLHPYERTSLTSHSLLDWFAEQGSSVAAVHFPHTFSRSATEGAIPALYCLYAPALQVTVPLTPEPDGTTAGRTTLTYFQHHVHLSVSTAQGHGTSVELVPDGTATAVRLRVGETDRVEASIPLGRLSFAVTIEDVGTDHAELSMGTCVLTLLFGHLDLSTVDHHAGPSSLSVNYTANADHLFHESPRAEWIARTAIQVLDRHTPDVLLVRFNQADHAQEFLYWHATRADTGTTARAWQQIVDTYLTIDTNVRAVAAAVGPDASYVFFSDHGIDWVETHIRPNTVLADLGWADHILFQGDSNCAFLYCDEPLTATEQTHIARELTGLHSSVHILSDAELRVLRLPATGQRVGRMVITSGAHTEFQYTGDQPVEAV